MILLLAWFAGAPALAAGLLNPSPKAPPKVAAPAKLPRPSRAKRLPSRPLARVSDVQRALRSAAAPDGPPSPQAQTAPVHPSTPVAGTRGPVVATSQRRQSPRAQVRARLVARRPEPGFDVLGYWIQRPGSGSEASYLANASEISEVGPLWYSVEPGGYVKQWWPQVVGGVVAAVHRRGGKVIALVNNAGGSGAVLHSAAATDQAVANLVAIARQNNLDGFNIDFEGITGYDAQGLVTFMRKLHAALAPLGLVTSVAVGPRASGHIPEGSLSAAYDYGALAPDVDFAVLMTYDEHGDGTPPGPVAGQAFVQDVLAYALRSFPPQKIFLGLADYGYDWSAGGISDLTDRQAEALARNLGVRVSRDPQSGEDHFSYTDASGGHHVVWFESGLDLAAKLALVRRDHLGGVGLWVLGSEDGATFPVIRSVLGPAHLTPDR